MRSNAKTTPSNRQIESEIERALPHEMWYADGRVDALKYAWDCRNDLDQLGAKAKEVEENIRNPYSALKDRMAPEASTRVYQDGYLAGLKEALAIIASALEPEQVVR